MAVAAVAAGRSVGACRAPTPAAGARWTARKPLMAHVDERDLQILQLRFGDAMTPAPVGAELGVFLMRLPACGPRS
ncbi:hypothetical protein ABZ721_15235 [Streptomyces sp. NPDC006733]|uniref:hypothetical protein n=1 Tax=Streptomyces sp. NPDC006733 TaxID=3155460 RepID=UPI0033CEAFB9